MVRTQIQLTEKQSLILKQLAEKEDVSVAEMIRRSVNFYIEQSQGVSAAERQKRLLSIIGIANSGLPDLGTNHDEYLAEIYAEVG